VKIERTDKKYLFNKLLFQIMTNHLPLKSFAFLSLFLLFVSCSSKDEGTPAAVLASNLVYSPTSLTITPGATGASAKPSVSGTLPVTYSLTTLPSSSAITIDSEGAIKTASTLPAGTYTVSVTATNAAGTAKFDNVYTITVQAQAPKNLIYSPNSSTVTQGTAVTSAAPAITSASAVTYAITTTPQTSAITINNQGVISATNALVAGSYVVSVTATNTIGASTFPSAYTINVNSITTSAVTYSSDVQAIIQSNCGSCHINGAQRSFNSYTNVKNNIDGILSRINLAQGASGMMPAGGTKLSPATINLIQKWKDDGLKE
jgi:hypothetical protein